MAALVTAAVLFPLCWFWLGLEPRPALVMSLLYGAFSFIGVWGAQRVARGPGARRYGPKRPRRSGAHDLAARNDGFAPRAQAGGGGASGGFIPCDPAADGTSSDTPGSGRAADGTSPDKPGSDRSAPCEPASGAADSEESVPGLPLRVRVGMYAVAAVLLGILFAADMRDHGVPQGVVHAVAFLMALLFTWLTHRFARNE